MPLLTRPVRRRTSTSATAYALLVAGTPRRLALARTGVGAGLLVRPRTLPMLLGIDSATSSRMAWSSSMLGAREVALGLGTLAALRSTDPRAARLWIAAGVLCDAVDVLAVGGAAVKGRLSRAPGGAAAASAAIAVLMGLRALRDDAAVL